MFASPKLCIKSTQSQCTLIFTNTGLNVLKCVCKFLCPSSEKRYVCSICRSLDSGSPKERCVSLHFECSSLGLLSSSNPQSSERFPCRHCHGQSKLFTVCKPARTFSKHVHKTGHEQTHTHTHTALCCPFLPCDRDAELLYNSEADMLREKMEGSEEKMME